MKLYRFSPIKNEDKLIEAVKYVAVQIVKLCKRTIGKELPVSYLTIFAHYDDEYRKLIDMLGKLGRLSKANNGIRAVLHKPIKVRHNTIAHLRIRKPDPYRMQVGCGDFEVKDYQRFKRIYLAKHLQNLRLIERPDMKMIEFFDTDFDVLAYIVESEKA